MTTDESIAAIKKILDEHYPGTWANGQRMIDFLKQAAEKEHELLGDDMSARED